MPQGRGDLCPDIPPMIQEFAFRPFVSYGKAEGSGFGLAIAKKIVEDHGGEIYLDRAVEPEPSSSSQFLCDSRWSGTALSVHLSPLNMNFRRRSTECYLCNALELAQQLGQ
jgi:signal transduction histidine kinase